MKELMELDLQSQVKAIINVSRDEVIGIVTERLANIFIQHGVADCPHYFVNVTEDPDKFMQFIFAGEPEVTESSGEVRDLELDGL